MGINSFWLFYIENDSVLVSLINWGNGRYYVASIGPRVLCDINDHQALIDAVDESLSSAATSADISEDQEPLFVGLVIPSSWVGEDGKITKSKAEIILPIFKELDLKPSGFMSNDEAILEEINKPDDFPASFINLYLESNSFELSLIYLGKIKKRIKKFFDGEFTAQLVEDSLIELNLESTLPPQIYVYGKEGESALEILKAFPWVGKKNVETFLHFPDIKLYQDNDLINIFFKAITSQMIGGGNPSHQPVPQAEHEEIEAETETEPEELEEIATKEEIEEVEEAEIVTEGEELEEVSFEDFAFSKESFPSESPPIEIINPPSSFIQPEVKKEPLSFKLPKINFKLPKLKSNFLFFIPLFILIILFIPLAFSKANITLFVTPYEFDKTVNITLDSDATDISASIIPVDKKTVTISSSADIETTGKKVIGTKATGEVSIINKSEKIQSIPKSTILVDSKGQKFELINAVEVAAGVINTEKLTMDLGQVKTVISASDIGPEYNIAKDETLTFKDSFENLIIKTNTDFTGGVKNEINAVSQQDKVNAEAELTQKLQIAADEKINQEFNTTNNAIKETIQTKKGKIDFNREIGEETNDLSATAESTVSVFVLKTELKEKILTQILSAEKGFSDSELNPDSFNFTFKIDKIDNSKATGSLTIKGKSLPKINTDLLKKDIAGKTIKKAQEIIRKNNTRVYDFNFKITLKIFNILPLNQKNIIFEPKSE